MTKEPIFNTPRIIPLFIFIFLGLYALYYYCDASQKQQILLYFSFIPARIGTAENLGLATSLFAQAWSFFTYAFLHGSFEHVLMNSVWFLVFATPLARRLSVLKFVAFFLLTSAFGALAHYFTAENAYVSMVGASAGVSGVTAASFRFMFSSGYVLSLREMLGHKQVLTMVLFWLVANVVFGFFVPLSDMPIAWQAHIGGFISGLLLFPLFSAYNHEEEEVL